MNCFQFVIWRSLTHLKAIHLILWQCCELLSICDLTIFDTPVNRKITYEVLLWIAFNLWFDDLWHTSFLSKSITHNCCELLSICDLTIFDTPPITIPQSPFCCELLSICDLTIFDTPYIQNNIHQESLWIAFNLWFDDLWHTSGQKLKWTWCVVNCFQFVIWRSLTHPAGSLDILFGLLWIAFNLWFDDLWHTYSGDNWSFVYVVNCFQFVIWRSLTHQTSHIINSIIRCELLSICDLTIFDTPR